jgi:hypothetical protein
MHHKEAPTASPEAILKDILDVLTCMHNGHFTPHLHETFPGVGGEIARLINNHLEMLQDFRREHHRIMEEVGVTGRLGGQGDVPALKGAWKEMMDETNRMGANITGQCRDKGNIFRALIRGDLSARATCTAIRGEFREFREELNELAEQFEDRSRAMASEPVPT